MYFIWKWIITKSELLTCPNTFIQIIFNLQLPTYLVTFIHNSDAHDPALIYIFPLQLFQNPQNAQLKYRNIFPLTACSSSINGLSYGLVALLWHFEGPLNDESGRTKMLTFYTPIRLWGHYSVFYIHLVEFVCSTR